MPDDEKLSVSFDDDVWSPEHPAPPADVPAGDPPIEISLQPSRAAATVPTPLVGAMPPVTTPTKQPSAPRDEAMSSWTCRRAWLAVIPAAVVILLLLGLAIVLMQDEGGADPEVLVADSGDEVAAVNADLEQASLLAELRELGAAAGERREAVDDLLAEVDEIEGDSTREEVEGLLTEQAALLATVAELEQLGDDDLVLWDELEPRLQEQLGDLEDAQEALPDDLADVSGEAFDVEALRRALVRTDDTIVSADEALTEWREQTAFVQVLNVAAVDELDDYQVRMQDLIGRYEGLRDDLADFTAQLDVRLVTVSEARSVLDRAATAREQVRSEMGATAPPESIAAAHAGVLDVLDNGIQGVREASAGLRQYEFDPFYFDVRETPGWNSFIATSDFNTTSLSQARGTWQGALDAARQQSSGTPLPERPEV
jgi:hypothetical protein